MYICKLNLIMHFCDLFTMLLSNIWLNAFKCINGENFNKICARFPIWFSFLLICLFVRAYMSVCVLLHSCLQVCVFVCMCVEQPDLIKMMPSRRVSKFYITVVTSISHCWDGRYRTKSSFTASCAFFFFFPKLSLNQFGHVRWNLYFSRESLQCLDAVPGISTCCFGPLRFQY